MKNNSKRSEKTSIDSSKSNTVKIKTVISSQAKANTCSPLETKSVSSTKENSVVKKSVRNEKKDISSNSKKTTNANSKEKKVVLDKSDARNLLSKKPVSVGVISKVKPSTSQPVTLDEKSGRLQMIIKYFAHLIPIIF